MSNVDNDLDFTNWKPPPDPPPTPKARPGEPLRRIITSKREFADAFDQLFGKTQRTLQIFDPDLSAYGMNTIAREQQLREFLGRRRTNRVRIVVHDTDAITQRMPRLMNVLRAYGHAIAIHQSQEEIRNLEDVLVVGDDAHCLRRPNSAHPRGAVYLDDAVETREWLNRFNAIWEHSVPAVSATTAGL